MIVLNTTSHPRVASDSDSAADKTRAHARHTRSSGTRPRRTQANTECTPSGGRRGHALAQTMRQLGVLATHRASARHPHRQSASGSRPRSTARRQCDAGGTRCAAQRSRRASTRRHCGPMRRPCRWPGRCACRARDPSSGPCPAGAGRARCAAPACERRVLSESAGAVSEPTAAAGRARHGRAACWRSRARRHARAAVQARLSRAHL
jgi:hypothetical protein